MNSGREKRKLSDAVGWSRIQEPADDAKTATAQSSKMAVCLD
jgi:hypothetical protein